LKNIEIVDVFKKPKDGRKYHNIFKDNFKIDLESYDFKIIEPSLGTRLGEKSEILENDKFNNYIAKCLDIKNDHLLYLVKANPGHHIEQGRIELMHNFKGSIKEVKSIWYLFINLEWEYNNKWIFRSIEDDTYNAPENNTIIEFDKNDSYEMSELISENNKHFIVIINF